MSEKLITTSRDGAAFIITLDRPEKRNAISAEMMWELGDAMDAAAAEKDARAIIIRASGKCFSAGIDLNTLAQLGQSLTSTADFRAVLARLQGVFNKMESLEKPVIAAIHNLCLGMGMELVLAADFRIASQDAQFSIPEVELGLIPDVGGTTRLTRLLGAARAKEMIIMCRRIDAARAYEIGLVNEVSPEDKLMETAMRWVAELAEKAPLAVGMAKKVINRGAHLDPLMSQELEGMAQSTLINSADVREGMMARLQKRKPEFKGK